MFLILTKLMNFVLHTADEGGYPDSSAEKDKDPSLPTNYGARVGEGGGGWVL